MGLARGEVAGPRRKCITRYDTVILVVVKLYLYDIWQLNQFYRILAFVVLGALLLSGSFLYSRYRHRLLELLKHDETI